MNITINSFKRILRLLLTSRCILIVAWVLIATGYLLMTGPESTEDAFNPDIFSSRRIIIAPILCLSGYLLIIAGILRKL
ncbi:MAG: DUF3098 domain-containing protein [Prevotella sp.]|nr:DUF3098 domain-containing protein [Prevotella sp.]